MPVPPPYYHATEQFEKFMLDARDAADLQTTNMAWNMVVGVLQAFRRRLSVEDAIAFSNHLPPGIRALFVADWNPYEQKLAFTTDAVLLDEIRSVRRQHNFSPEHAHRAVAIAMRKNVELDEFDRCLRLIGEDAYSFWYVSPEVIQASPEERELKLHFLGD